jgi:SAM-dependent methyltransferase
MASAPQVYDKSFYGTQMTGSQRSASKILPLVTDWIKPTTAIDVGCGVGTWTSELLRLGVDAIGVDGPWVRSEMLVVPAERFIVADLDSLDASKFGRKFDLCVCLEVAEHLSPSGGARFVEVLTTLAPVVLFSAAIPGQGGTRHTNERWQSYWAELFRARGFVAYDAVRPRVRGDKDVEWWYRQNVVVYIESSASTELPDAVKVHEASAVSLDLVDPALYRVATSSVRRMIKNTISVLRGR